MGKILLTILLASLLSACNGGSLEAQDSGPGSFARLTTADTVGELLNHPAFAGFGRLLLPWDNRDYDESLALSGIGTLMPYHNNVNPAEVVTSLNRLIDDAEQGETFFFDYYTPQQKQADQDKNNTGLFFFRGDPGAPFAIVCPGGGWSYVGSLHEGLPLAEEISRQGYNAFVIKYRTGNLPGGSRGGEQRACEDLAAALSYIFRNAQTLGVSTEGYSLWGGSAGARMAACLASRGSAFYGGDALPRPAAVVMGYTGHGDYSPSDPPTFAYVGELDTIASPAVMERRMDNLRSAGVTVEFHRYRNTRHGFGLGTGTPAEGWIERAIDFWTKLIK
ncbi:alpha/beta hydrolase [Breznakiella homolactica]|uniref:Alpha/beta hydrolase n=1 Tax=Breznakiella homolactica TaxID=2798577 RepID=A0A7T8B987_9SPIR|nr:alpha/beta hydrolase [Breznakiella homolactica]QQO07700.1 alpha/beta hydrolase [Breznakiella homolactica]